MGEVACLAREEPECPFCDVKLVFNDEHGYYKCPDCGGEWWPGSVAYDVVTLWRDEQAYKKMLRKPGGGSNSSGRKRGKQETQKRPWLSQT